MKTKKIIVIPAMVLSGALLSISSCKKSQISSLSMQKAQSQSQFVDATNGISDLDSIMNDDFNLVNEDNQLSAQPGSKCYTVSYYPSRKVYPQTKTIDFG